MSARTRVLFRVVRLGGCAGDVVAVFPGLVESRGDVTCYTHVGQHGSCSLEWVRARTRRAKPSEYASLARELESIGYSLLIGRAL